MARTRQRITEAAVELHGTIGPAATTMSAVADRAGITRATLYRHFPNEEALFAACSGEWLAAHPPPDATAWTSIADPRSRVHAALGGMYDYYRATEAMMANLLRDAASMPASIVRDLASYPDAIVAILDAGWERSSSARLRRAAMRHAILFETWRSLAQAGLSDAEAASLMTLLVVAAHAGSIDAPGDASTDLGEAGRAGAVDSGDRGRG